MRKMKGLFIFLGIICVSFLANVNGVKADSYELKLVPYNVTDVCDLEEEGGQECFKKYLNGDLKDYEIKDGIVSPNENIMIVQLFVPTENSKVTSLQYAVKYDTSKVDYYVSSYGEEYGVIEAYDNEEDNNVNYGYNYGPNGKSTTDTYFPIVTSGRNKLKPWNKKIDGIFENLNKGLVQGFSFSDGEMKYPLTNTTPFSALFYTVKSNLNSGSKIRFEYLSYLGNHRLTSVFESGISASNLDLSVLELSVLSNDTTLKELKAIGNDEVNYLASIFDSYSNILEYDIKVPNKVNTIKFVGIASNSNIKSIEGININDNLIVGDNKFNISVTAENGEVSIYKININRLSNDYDSLDKIISSIYEVKRIDNPESGELNYIIGLEPLTMLKDFILNFDNNPELLHVYNQDGSEIIDKETYIGTKMTIKLEISNEVLDELEIVVRGDLNGDSSIDIADFDLMNLYLLKRIDFDYIEIQAADLYQDGYVDVTDYSRLNSYLLKILSTLN